MPSRILAMSSGRLCISRAGTGTYRAVLHPASQVEVSTHLALSRLYYVALNPDISNLVKGVDLDNRSRSRLDVCIPPVDPAVPGC